MSAPKAYVIHLDPSDVTEPGMVWHAEWPTGKSSLGITEWAWAEFPTWDEAMSAALAGITKAMVAAGMVEVRVAGVAS